MNSVIKKIKEMDSKTKGIIILLFIILLTASVFDYLNARRDKKCDDHRLLTNESNSLFCVGTEVGLVVAGETIFQLLIFLVEFIGLFALVWAKIKEEGFEWMKIK